MKFLFRDGYIKCETCGYLFSRDVPHDKPFSLQCPECGAQATYLVEWFVNEIVEDDEEIEEECAKRAAS